LLAGLQQPGELPERPKEGVSPSLSSDRRLTRGGCCHCPSAFDFPSDDIRAIGGFVVNRRPVEALDGPARAAEDPIPLSIVLVTHSLVVRCAIRFDGYSNVWKSKVRVISLNVELRERASPSRRMAS